MATRGESPSQQDRRWKQESDARTLAEADVIQNTPNRLAGAKKAAKRMAEEERKQAEAMTKIATGSAGSSKSGGEKSKKRATQKKRKPKNQFNIGQRI